MPYSWINHQGAKIIRVDYDHLKQDQIVTLIREVSQQIAKTAGPVHMLIVLGDSRLNKAILDEYKSVSLNTDKNHLKKMAYVGIQGFQKVIFESISRLPMSFKFKTFDDEESAKDYLAAP